MFRHDCICAGVLFLTKAARGRHWVSSCTMYCFHFFSVFETGTLTEFGAYLFISADWPHPSLSLGLPISLLTFGQFWESKFWSWCWNYRHFTNGAMSLTLKPLILILRSGSVLLYFFHVMSDCGDMNDNCLTKAHISEYLVLSRWQ